MIVDFRKRWNKALKVASVRNLRFHDLRHTFATMFLKSGNTLAELKVLLGHQNEKTTMRYAHLANEHEHLKNAINKIEF